MKSFWSNKKVTVTGGAGFLGQHLVKRLESFGAEVYVPRQRDYNLTTLDACLRCLLEHPCDVLFHAAAYYGGIGINQTQPATLYYSNLVMGANLMEAARLAEVKKFVAIGTACSYPGYLEGHLKEDDLWAGPCHASVVNYGLTKKMMAVQAQAYKRQYGLDSIHLILTNLYGPGRLVQPRAVARRRGPGPEVGRGRAGQGPLGRGLGHRQAGPRVHLRRGLRRRHRPGRREVRRRRHAAQHRHRHRHLDPGAVRDRPRGQRLQGQDDLERRQARRRRGQGARRDPDEGGPRRLDPADQAQRRPGQDGRLVPGQQGPGGRQVVNTRPGSIRPAADPGPGPTAPPRPRAGRRSGSTRVVTDARPRRLLFVNQYYWPDHASTAQHLADLAEHLAARGHEVHVLCSRGGYKPGRRAAAGPRGPQRRHDPPGRRHLARPQEHAPPDDRLPELLRPGLPRWPSGSPGSTWSPP